MSTSTPPELLSVRDAAERRRSVRAFDPAPVPHADLEAILASVLRAPSAFNVQPWRFVVVESPAVRGDLAAESHGYQTSPTAGFDPEAVKRLLGLPAHVRVPALVAIGRGAEEGVPHRRHALARVARYA